MRFFNTAGPCEPDLHYMLPAVARLPEAPQLIERGSYFVLHAPRQTGKTTTLRALAKAVTAEGRYTGLYFSCKTAEAAAGEPRQAQLAILEQLRRRAQHLPPELRPPQPWPEAPELELLGAALCAWARISPRPLVLFFDEIDTLFGAALRAVLAQLHAGFPERPGEAPYSVVLCGLRDVRDYREAAGKDPGHIGSASPFTSAIADAEQALIPDIKVKSLRLGDFSLEEVGALYEQHRAQTGQAFSDEATRRVHELSAGQPWLVNALAREIIDEMKVTAPLLSVEDVDRAKDRLILARQTHLDSLLARLREERVRRVLEPVIAGAAHISGRYQDDIEYVQDLGLFAVDRPVRVANPIYREVIVRALADTVQQDLVLDPRTYLAPDGRIDMDRLLQRFMEFFRESGELLEGDMPYHEVAPQLVMMAFLQGAVNGQGSVAREYGLGRDRIDLLLRWPYGGPPSGAGRKWQSEAIELKVWRDRRADPREAGLAQLDAYLDRLALDHGYLVIFDRRSGAGALSDRLHLETARTEKGRTVIILRA